MISNNWRRNVILLILPLYLTVSIFKVWILWLPPRNGRIWMRKYGIVQNLSKGNTSLICLRSNYMHDQDILFWNDNAVNKSSKKVKCTYITISNIHCTVVNWGNGNSSTFNLQHKHVMLQKFECGFKFMSFWNEVSMCNSALNETESFGMRKLLIFYQIITLFFHRME